MSVTTLSGSAAITMLCRFLTTIGGMYWWATFKTKTSSPLWYIDFFSPKIHKQNVLSYSGAIMSSNTFSNHFSAGGYRISECRTSSWYFYTLTAFVSEIWLVLRHSRVRFRPRLRMHKYHVLSMTYFLDVTFLYQSKVGLFIFMATYIPFIGSFVFPSSTKREMRHFHVIVVQRRLGNVQKCVMHVQSCCFITHN